MSRPPKSRNDRLSQVITFRLPEAVYERLRQKAERCGISVNQLSRRLTKKGEDKLVVKTHKQLDPAFLKRIDRIGHNLNQLVKNAHIFGRVSPKVEEVCLQIRELIQQAIEEESEE